MSLDHSVHSFDQRVLAICVCKSELRVVVRVRVNFTHYTVLHVRNELLVLHLLLNQSELLLLELDGLLVLLKFSLILLPQLFDVVSVFLLLQLDFLFNLVDRVQDPLFAQIEIALELKSPIFLITLLLLKPLVLRDAHLFNLDVTHFLGVFELSYQLSNIILGLVQFLRLVGLQVLN